MAPYVLVVESDLVLQKRIGETLTEASYDLAAEAEFAWAKRSLSIRTPDAIIVDTSLSDGSGFRLAEELRKDAETARVPFFFIASTYRGASHAAEARRRFAPAEYFPTPLDLDRLLARLLQTVPPSEPSAAHVVPDYPGSVKSDPEQRRERRSVESTAKHLLAEATEMRGSLSRQPFARVLQRIYAGQMSGALLLLRDKVKKIVYFEDGYPVSVRSNVASECLGQILLEQHMISPEILTESLRKMRDTRKHQGEVLVEMGALSPYNLSRALILQMEYKLLEVFSWTSGDFAFKKGRPSHDDPVHLERTPAALILEGIRRYYDEERMQAVLEPYSGHYIAPNADPRRHLQDITADGNERRFIDSLNGSVKLEAALATSPVAIDRARLLLVAMSEAGMVTPARNPRGQKTDEQRTPPPHHEPVVAGQGNERSREELAALAEVMRVQNHFEVLGVDRDATPGEILEAHQALAREFHPDVYRLRPDDVREAAAQVFALLDEAHRVLSDSTSRRKYLAQLERGAATKHTAQASGAAESSTTAAERVYFTGVSHLRARRYRLASEAFRQATALAPQNASYRSALGWALYRQAPTDSHAVTAGLAELRQAIEIEPENPWLRISLGRFFAETGLPDDAIREFETALRMSPGLSDIEEEIRRLRGEI